MTKIVLLNDVDAGFGGLLAGQMEAAPTKKGESEAKKVSQFIHDHIPRIERLVASPSMRINNLIHRVRVSSDDLYLAKIQLYRNAAFLERDFGVLENTPFDPKSEIFSQTRILPEGGESVAQFRDRVLPALRAECKRDRVVLLISHPFVCQLCTNALLGNLVTSLSRFWIELKGSFIVIETDELCGTFCSAFNAIEKKSYTLEEIYE